MINYANRGKALQMLINSTNAVYKQKGWALVDEVPTPSKNIKGRIIYERKSTVDYYGISQGRGIAFDAKSTKETKRFDLKNVHDHQVQYLDHFLKQGGIAFLLIEFARLREFYFVSIPFFLNTGTQPRTAAESQFHTRKLDSTVIRSGQGAASR